MVKKEKPLPLPCTCPFVKDYIISEPPTAAEIEDFVVQSEGEKLPFTGTIAKGKASLKSPVKGKKPPKIAFKKVAEARHCTNDIKVCAIKQETKKAGQLTLLKFNSEEDVEKFISMLRLKNPSVKVVKSTDRQPMGDPMTSLSADNKDRLISPTGLKISVTSNKDKEHSKQTHMSSSTPHLKQIDTTTSALNIMHTSRSTSPQYDIHHKNIVDITHKMPSAERYEPNRRTYRDTSPPPPKSRSYDSSKHRHSRVSVSSQTSHKSKPRNRRGLKSLLSSSSSLSSTDGKHRTRSSSRNHGRRSSSSSLSSIYRKRRSQKSRSHDRRSRRVDKSGSSSCSYSGLSGSKTPVSRHSNKLYTNSDLIIPKNEMHLESGGPSRRFSSVNHSIFSLMRIAKSQRSITNLYSFGVALPHSTTSLSHRISSNSSGGAGSSLNISESRNGSNSSYISSSTSDVTMMTRNMHSSHQESKYRSMQSPSPQVSQVI
ncbi:hypothetical protein Aperf_G00000037526 [Anoplocephala perfoliata]